MEYNVKQITDNEIQSIADYLYDNGAINKYLIKCFFHNRVVSYKKIIKYESVMHVIYLIEKTLTKFGFSNEEVYMFIYNNKGMLLEPIEELKLKFSILHDVDLLEYVLIKKPTNLYYNSILTASRLYAFIKYLDFRGIKPTFKNIFSIKCDYTFYDKLCRSFVFKDLIRERYLSVFEEFLNSRNNVLNLKESN